MLREVAKTLIHEGFVVVPQSIHNISVELIEEASKANQDLIQFMSGLKCPTAVHRPGEEEAEVGMVHHPPEDGKDIKYFLHTDRDFWQLVMAEPELYQELKKKCAQVETILNLYNQLTILILDVLTHVQSAVDFPLLEDSLRQSFVRSCTESLADNTTILRGLLYQASEGHKGARGHPDRSFITAHLGDYGGSLFGHRERGRGEAFLVSPERGEILLFFGVKAPIASNGILMPLWHSATSREDEDRTAMVMFGHVITPFQIDDAKKALNDYCESIGVDPDEWYESFWKK